MRIPKLCKQNLDLNCFHIRSAALLFVLPYCLKITRRRAGGMSNRYAPGSVWCTCTFLLLHVIKLAIWGQESETKSPQVRKKTCYYLKSSIFFLLFCFQHSFWLYPHQGWLGVVQTLVSLFVFLLLKIFSTNKTRLCWFWRGEWVHLTKMKHV